MPPKKGADDTTSSSIPSPNKKRKNQKDKGKSKDTNSIVTNDSTDPIDLPEPPSTQKATTATTPANKVQQKITSFQQCRKMSVAPPKISNPYSSLRSRKSPTQDDMEIDEDDNTVQNNNTSSNTEYQTRYSLKITIDASPTPMIVLTNAIKGLLSTLKRNGEDNLCLLPWRETDHRPNSIITNPTNLPRTTSQLTKYLSNIYELPKDTTRTIYTNIYIGHDCEPYEMSNLASPWVSRTQGIFKMMVQAEFLSEIGWFLSSTRHMDAGALSDAIEAELGMRLGLRWKVVPMGQAGTIADADKVRALTIECDRKYRREYQKELTKFYQRTLKDFTSYPNGLRLRYVPPIREAYSLSTRSKCRRLLARQKIFNDTIKTIHCQDIMDLDVPANSNIATLRQLIMSIPSQQYTECSLFHNVSLNYRGDGHILECLPPLEAEATVMANTFIPFLKHHVNDDIMKYFTIDAIDRCEDLRFDPNTGECVDTLQDKNVDIAIDTELLGEKNPNYSGPLNDAENQIIQSTTASATSEVIDLSRPDVPSHLNTHYFRQDDDSVSTMGNGTTASGIRATNPSNRPRYDSISVANSHTSSSSVMTEQSFVSLQSQVAGMSNTLATILKKMDQLGTASSQASQPVNGLSSSVADNTNNVAGGSGS